MYLDFIQAPKVHASATTSQQRALKHHEDLFNQKANTTCLTHVRQEPSVAELLAFAKEIYDVESAYYGQSETVTDHWWLPAGFDHEGYSTAKNLNQKMHHYAFHHRDKVPPRQFLHDFGFWIFELKVRRISYNLAQDQWGLAHT